MAEQVLLRPELGVQGAGLYAHRRRDVTHRRPVVTASRKQLDGGLDEASDGAVGDEVGWEQRCSCWLRRDYSWHVGGSVTNVRNDDGPSLRRYISEIVVK
jgi:hypothetical protein